jgi:hypothetical protein
MWETDCCVHIQSSCGRLKPLQSFWYTVCYPLIYVISHVVFNRALWVQEDWGETYYYVKGKDIPVTGRGGP